MAKTNTVIIRPSRTGFGVLPDDFERTWVQHGIASIIAYSGKVGLSVDLIDVRRLKGWDEFDERVSGYKYVGISAFSSDFSNAQECIRHIRKVSGAGAVIIVGGAHANVRPEDWLKNPEVDHVVLGEGEIAFPALVSSLNGGLPAVRLWADNPRVILDDIPYIDRSLWGPEDDGFWATDQPFFTVISSRACFRTCRFCHPYSRMVFGNKMRNRSVGHLIGELKMLQDKHGMKSFDLLDDNALQDPRWMEDFIAQYVKAGIKAQFLIEGSADYVCKNPGLLPALKTIGCRWVNVGFESGSQHTLDLMHKQTTVEQNRQAAEIIHAAGLKIFANIMFGIPGETKQDALESVKFVQWMKPDWLSPSFYTPYPGNELAEECEEKGLSIHYDDSSEEWGRAAGRPKIRGVDYAFLEECVRRCYSNSTHPLQNAIGRLPGPVVSVLRKGRDVVRGIKDKRT